MSHNKNSNKSKNTDRTAGPSVANDLPANLALEEHEINAKKDRLKDAPWDALVAVVFAAENSTGFVLNQWLCRNHDPIM